MLSLGSFLSVFLIVVDVLGFLFGCFLGFFPLKKIMFTCSLQIFGICSEIVTTQNLPLDILKEKM